MSIARISPHGHEEITQPYESYANGILWGTSNEIPPRNVYDGSMPSGDPLRLFFGYNGYPPQVFDFTAHGEPNPAHDFGNPGSSGLPICQNEIQIPIPTQIRGDILLSLADPSSRIGEMDTQATWGGEGSVDLSTQGVSETQQEKPAPAAIGLGRGRRSKGG
ncbi:hypothetical protein BGW80DRAFT_1254704 [Lactifluus volemus]|nr:hypothetical protein BGW80DRAFT_1254704 [Lactifluus volemus]